MTKIKKNLFIIAITNIIFFSLLIVIIIKENNIIPFNSLVWKNIPIFRYSMSNSLVKILNHSNLSINDIKKLLGEAFFIDSENTKLIYHLKNNNLIFGIDNYWLGIEISNNEIKAYVYRED